MRFLDKGHVFLYWKAPKVCLSNSRVSGYRVWKLQDGKIETLLSTTSQARCFKMTSALLNSLNSTTQLYICAFYILEGGVKEGPSEVIQIRDVGKLGSRVDNIEYLAYDYDMNKVVAHILRPTKGGKSDILCMYLKAISPLFKAKLCQCA